MVLVLHYLTQQRVTRYRLAARLGKLVLNQISQSLSTLREKKTLQSILRTGETGGQLDYLRGRKIFKVLYDSVRIIKY